MRHFSVQIQGGLAIHRGVVAEMLTGEGKTLTATIPAYLQALEGRSVLIATANDYLAQRDTEMMEPVYSELGLTVGCIQSGQPRDDRRRAYNCDVTYGTAREFGFDFLRDRLEARRRDDPKLAMFASGPVRVQRAPGFLLLDEADSLLIDEARTPLILSGPLDQADAAHAACYAWAADVAPDFEEPRHYVRDRFSGWPALTGNGRARIRGLAMPPATAPLGLTEIHHFVERAIFVVHRYQRDRHYVVRDDKVQIVDEFTGRIQPGRTWNDGLHQAIEAREGVPLTVETGHLARVTIQEYVRRFPHISGMTGTAQEAAREFRAVYGLAVKAIPPNRPLRRQRLPDAVFHTAAEKRAGIISETRRMLEQGRSLLVGTPTIAASQQLAEDCGNAGVEVVVLNALNPQAEAEVIAQAGEPRRVTIATNMAGRGTDIRLNPAVLKAGGLHVIATELHAASRIDRQLEGRCGRQGDSGSYRQFLSLEDEILAAAHGVPRAERLARRHSRGSDEATISRLLREAQKTVEREHFRQRQELMQFDEQLHRATESLGLDPVLDAVS